jgi:hypothetical protein
MLTDSSRRDLGLQPDFGFSTFKDRWLLGAIDTPTNSLSGVHQTRIKPGGTKLPRLPDGA